MFQCNFIKFKFHTKKIFNANLYNLHSIQKEFQFKKEEILKIKKKMKMKKIVELKIKTF